MNKIYIAALCGILFFGAYFAGYKIASEKCRTEFANQNSTQIQNLIDQQGEINAETNHTATDVIRDRLRDKYTIKN